MDAKVQGGPSMVPNHDLDAMIVVNTTHGRELIKEPIFYTMAHFRLEPGAYSNLVQHSTTRL